MARMERRRAGLRALALGALALAAIGPQAAFAGGSATAAITPSAAGESAPTDRLIIKYRAGMAGTSAAATAAERLALHRSAQDVALRHGVQMKLLRVGAFDTQVMRLDRRLAHADAQRLGHHIMASDPRVDHAEAH